LRKPGRERCDIHEVNIRLSPGDCKENGTIAGVTVYPPPVVMFI